MLNPRINLKNIGNQQSITDFNISMTSCTVQPISFVHSLNDRYVYDCVVMAPTNTPQSFS